MKSNNDFNQNLEIYKKLIPLSSLSIQKGNPIKVYVIIDPDLLQAYKTALKEEQLDAKS